MSSSDELIREAHRLIDAIEETAAENDGDISAYDAMLDDYLERASDKQHAILHYIHKMKNEEDYYRAKEVRLAKRRRSIQKHRAFLLERLMQMRKAAVELGADFAVMTSDYSVYLRKSATVVVTPDLDDVDVDYLVEQPPTVDKKKAMTALKAGEELAGLSLNYNESLNWRLF